MVDKEMLEAISQMMDAKLDAKLEPILQDLAQLKEDSTITRNAVNTLLDWAEEAQVEVRIPLLKKVL